MKRLKLILLLIVAGLIQLFAGEKWIVTDAELSVWNSPDYQKKLGMIHKGYEIDAEGMEGDMIRFVYEGQTAYVASYCCKKVEAEENIPTTSKPATVTPADNHVQVTRSAGKEVQELSSGTSGQGFLAKKDADGKQQTDAMIEKVSSLPVWLLGLLCIFGLAYGGILILALVFTFYYVFNYNKLRLWFNGKCGVDCVPAKRFNKLLQAPLLAVMLMVFANVLTAKLMYAIPDSLSIAAVILSLAIVIGTPVLILSRSYIRQKHLYGARATRWLTVYSVLSVAALYFVCVIAFFVICLVAVLFVCTFLLKQTGPGKALDMSNRSCSNCNKFGTSFCPNKEQAGNGCCDAHSW